MDDDDLRPSRFTARRARDLFALLCILTGVVGLVVCAFAQDRLLGYASVATSVLVLGVILGLDR